MERLKLNLTLAVTAFAVSVIFAILGLPLLKRLKAGQPVLKYVESHKGKNGTPTMGGLFFILSATSVFCAFGGINGRIATVIAVIGLAFTAVGFLDDFIKVKYKKNEGLKPYQKIIFQTAVSFVAGVFAYTNGLTVLYLPFVKKSVDIGVFSIPFTAFIFIALTNGVNLTDGLDGLAGSVGLIYIFFISLLIFVETETFSYMYLKPEEYSYLISLCYSLLGGIAGFLLFNVNKAQVFMGDTGSLGLGGFIAGISVFSSNSLFIPLLGITFVFSLLSVIIQVIHFKRTGKRVFLMSPYHHHLQMKGLSESKIAFIYSTVTVIMGTVLVIFYL